MVIGISVITCCLLYSIMLLVIYFGKERITTTENKIYSILITINFIGLVLELACTYFTYNYGTDFLNNFMCIFCNKLFVIYLLTWEVIFTLYMFFISFGINPRFKDKIFKNQKKIIITVTILYVVMLAVSIYLPLYYHNTDGLVYSYGPATDLLVAMGGTFILFDIFCIVWNFKNVKYQKYLPLIILAI